MIKFFKKLFRPSVPQDVSPRLFSDQTLRLGLALDAVQSGKYIDETYINYWDGLKRRADHKFLDMELRDKLEELYQNLKIYNKNRQQLATALEQDIREEHKNIGRSEYDDFYWALTDTKIIAIIAGAATKHRALGKAFTDIRDKILAKRNVLEELSDAHVDVYSTKDKVMIIFNTITILIAIASILVTVWGNSIAERQTALQEPESSFELGIAGTSLYGDEMEYTPRDIEVIDGQSVIRMPVTYRFLNQGNRNIRLLSFVFDTNCNRGEITTMLTSDNTGDNMVGTGTTAYFNEYKASKIVTPDEPIVEMKFRVDLISKKRFKDLEDCDLIFKSQSNDPNTYARIKLVHLKFTKLFE